MLGSNCKLFCSGHLFQICLREHIYALVFRNRLTCKIFIKTTHIASIYKFTCNSCAKPRSAHPPSQSSQNGIHELIQCTLKFVQMQEHSTVRVSNQSCIKFKGNNCQSMQCFPGDLHRDPGFCEASALQQPPGLAPSRAGLLQDRGGLPAPAGTPRACACACACPEQHPAPLMSATGAAQDAAAAAAACADGMWSCVAVPRVDPPQRPVEKLLQQLLVFISTAALAAGCVQSVLSCSAE